jgi:hypothetical protein
MMRRAILLMAASLSCAGCGRAPAVDIIGSFFPAWIVCVTIAVVLACVLRVFLLRWQFEQEVGPVALFYPSVVVLLSCTLWLIFFR